MLRVVLANLTTKTQILFRCSKDAGQICIPNLYDLSTMNVHKSKTNVKHNRLFNPIKSVYPWRKKVFFMKLYISFILTIQLMCGLYKLPERSSIMTAHVFTCNGRRKIEMPCWGKLRAFRQIDECTRCTNLTIFVCTCIPHVAYTHD